MLSVVTIQKLEPYGVEESESNSLGKLPSPGDIWSDFASIDMKPTESLESEDETTLERFCISVIDHFTKKVVALQIGGVPGGMPWKNVRWFDGANMARWWTASGRPDFILVDLESGEGASIQEEEYGYATYRKRVKLESENFNRNNF